MNKQKRIFEGSSIHGNTLRVYLKGDGDLSSSFVMEHSSNAACGSFAFIAPCILAVTFVLYNVSINNYFGILYNGRKDRLLLVTNLPKKINFMRCLFFHVARYFWGREGGGGGGDKRGWMWLSRNPEQEFSRINCDRVVWKLFLILSWNLWSMDFIYFFKDNTYMVIDFILSCSKLSHWLHSSNASVNFSVCLPCQSQCSWNWLFLILKVQNG